MKISFDPMAFIVSPTYSFPKLHLGRSAPKNQSSSKKLFDSYTPTKIKLRNGRVIDGYRAHLTADARPAFKHPPKKRPFKQFPEFERLEARNIASGRWQKP